MATEFHLPDIGEGLAEATILHWFVAVGETVEVDAPLVEVETDKAVVEIPAPIGGVVLHHGAEADEVLAVEHLLAVIGEVGEEWTPSEAPAGTHGKSVADDAAPIVGTLDTGDAPSVGQGVQALPLVRKLAGELGVDLSNLSGSGPGGRITEDDVRAGAERTIGPHTRVPLSATRKAIVRNLTRSWQEIPHVTTYGSVDASRLLAERAKAGKVPLEAVLIARLIPVLKKFRGFNATFAGDAVLEHDRYDIGFAVDTPDGLMVAVIAGADGKSVADIGSEVRLLAAGAKERTLDRGQLTGQTFTISNIGAVGGRFGTPLVPYGTTAILSIGRADPQAVVRGGEIVIASEFPLSLSYDHRVIDGGTGRAFMADIIEALGT
ncbi:MAG: dihydrolipoamide acetyltransferase family protein [Actinomycetota bacterium]|nr:dihydrolipoamide acetyltransferase family protein [Actinomycetota bacterium]